ncbi:TetR family transcriptional regulator [Brachyspira hampsonii]|uniref:TetR family transcriptional regulator n=1 Tax=Brachyspira hampsonii TaxID=1287055 RepID=A0AAC9TQW3_9SPIR|nr:TetR/AcrR family transcriptional regulator [Brachyspira hampsonii]ASJ20133.1 TetR family transcriptional regulator [Brachyspira hampsonii]OEJ19772.1 TetR family transcriptional regulator [Brachyspira hampsonii]
MKNDKKDLRIIKTQKLLKDSLLELLKNNSLKDISVTEICEHALVNRVTFYDHFNNKEELLNSIIDDIKEDIIKELKKDNSIYDFKKNHRKILEKVINYFDDNKQYFNVSLIDSNNTLLFVSSLYKIFLEYLGETMKSENAENTKIMSQFFSGALVSVIFCWVKDDNNNKINKEDLLNNISILLEKSFK